MGTSASGTGPRPITPLIPSWIPDLDFPDNPNPDGGDDSAPNPDEPRDGENDGDRERSNNDNEFNFPQIPPKRYNESRRDMNKFSRDPANDSRLKKSLKSYVRKAGGGSSKLATRVTPSIKRVSSFYSVINTIRSQGLSRALLTFNLQEYDGRPVLDVLSALTDVIFDKSRSQYSDVQDDSITKLAYVNTINRIAGDEGIDLNSLRNEDIAVMMAIFIEETIATRVICEVGVKLYENIKHANEILHVEETIYQIVSGLVRNQIMPEILATQIGAQENIESSIKNIYRIAFDCISETNN